MQPTVSGFDPFVAPPTVPIGAVRVRDQVAVAGTVCDLEMRHWAGGGRALHVTVRDGTGSLVVAFLGRRCMPGVEPGRVITVGGAVTVRRGRLLMMNPRLWLGCGALVDA